MFFIKEFILCFNFAVARGFRPNDSDSSIGFVWGLFCATNVLGRFCLIKLLFAALGWGFKIETGLLEVCVLIIGVDVEVDL